MLAGFWHGPAIVIFGHWAHRGLGDLPHCKGLDTGCVCRGRLTGLCWPPPRVGVSARSPLLVSTRRFLGSPSIPSAALA